MTANFGELWQNGKYREETYSAAGNTGSENVFSGYLCFMQLSSKIDLVLDGLTADVINSSRIVTIAGLSSTAVKGLVVSRLASLTTKMIVIIVDSNADLENWERDLRFFADRSNADASSIVSLPAFETDVYSGASPHAETLERRALALWTLARQRPRFVIASAKSVVTRLNRPSKVMELGKLLQTGEDHDVTGLIESLTAGGYSREEPLNNVGQFSVRGGILDVWPPNLVDPVRVEFFGDTVESVRGFNAETQLSTNLLTEVPIVPMREFSASSKDLEDWAFFARERFPDSKFARTLKDRTDFAEEGEPFSGWEFLLPLSQPREATIFDYLPECLFIIDEPSSIERELSSIYDRLADRHRETLEIGEIGLEPSELFVDGVKLRELLGRHARIELRALGKGAAQTDEQFTLNEDGHTSAPLFLFPTAERSIDLEISSRSTRKYNGDVHQLARELRPDETAAIFVMGSAGMAERMSEILREEKIEIGPDTIVVGDISSGFELPSIAVTLYTELDIFGETQQIQVHRPVIKAHTVRTNIGAFISDFRDLKPGDYVVHVDHGIGRFEALQTISAQGSEREFMLLVYADDAKLFVPVERLDLVTRYSSGEATSPTLDRLGGLGWQKTKAKAKRAMRDMADELLKLYAERKLVRGYAFSQDAPWQHEFEDAFPFDLTPDQSSAITDVKADMETASPMDRLIIGDVGYGKTEVAMRAAFKAVMDGKQTAILTPTTVLAYQHFESFVKRFAAFPVKIELLSRFRTKKEQTSVVEAAGKGDVDVLIGTHRILSNDVSMPKLGLVVVDEEQRFGVAHKEKLKHLKKKVDVLTLSATPIPRTLNMSLVGMRDMSVIETPPRDRLAINTQVVQFSEAVIKSAVELELGRQGQIFFIHNRVETIEAIAALVQKIVPQARIAVGHGQMNEKEMEQVMLDFIDYKYDLLVATTIIENGIDIPRANTIIINRADNYGLSQLYQLRGRVGRSNRRAYAYLLIPSELELTPIARRRLSAIREFSDLGAGFRLAALDLELRGAGNILGGQQSGHLDALGFDLYTKMLERTIAEIRGDEIADDTTVSINLGVDVAIPKEYIQETGQRLRTYKRISSADSEADLLRIHSELQDRYGKLPHSVDSLFAFNRLRKLAERLRMVSIDRAGNTIAIKFSETSTIAPEKIMNFLAAHEDASFSPTGILRVGIEGAELIETAIESLREIG